MKNVAVDRSLRGRMGVIIGEPDLAASHLTADDPIEPVRGDTERAVDAGRPTVEELYVELAPELIRFAVSLVGPSEAEDLLGAAVAKAIASSRLDRVDNRRAYLYRMLVNEAHNSRRSEGRRFNREIRVVHRDAVEMERGLDPDVLAALKRLSVRQRAVIHLTYWADLPPQHVADTIGTSLRTVERELTNARTRLEAILS
jgi:RNA polymerase sigma factor (sigma-70 family)